MSTDLLTRIKQEMNTKKMSRDELARRSLVKLSTVNDILDNKVELENTVIIRRFEDAMDLTRGALTSLIPRQEGEEEDFPAPTTEQRDLINQIGRFLIDKNVDPEKVEYISFMTEIILVCDISKFKN